MTNGLEQLLDDIHPSKTVVETANRAGRAIGDFDEGNFDDIDAFLDHMVRCWCVCMTVMLRVQGGFPEASPAIARGLVLDILTEAFGPNGVRIAFDMACTGAEGGLYRVLKEFARAMAGQFTKDEIAAKVNTYWNSLTAEEKLTAPEEYLEKYGRVLPPGYEWNVRGHFRDVLLKHPQMIQQLERIGRD